MRNKIIDCLNELLSMGKKRLAICGRDKNLFIAAELAASMPFDEISVFYCPDYYDRNGKRDKLTTCRQINSDFKPDCVLMVTSRTEPDEHSPCSNLLKEAGIPVFYAWQMINPLEHIIEGREIA